MGLSTPLCVVKLNEDQPRRVEQMVIKNEEQKIYLKSDYQPKNHLKVKMLFFAQLSVVH